MQNCVQVRHRDMSVLSFLYEQGPATSDQLTSRFFTSKWAFYSRIKALKQAGLVVSEKYIRVGNGGYSKIYRLSDKVIEKVKYGSKINHENLINHQVGLNDVRNFLTHNLSPSKIFTEVELKDQDRAYNKIN